MAANLVESDLHQLANIFINDFDIEYRKVNFLSHASPYMNKIIMDSTINSSVISVHSKSPIQHESGVFFLAETRCGFSESYFGNTKLCVRPHLVITEEKNNLYFGDFLCFKVSPRSLSRTHYVTIVVSKRGSPEDGFCNDNLVKLDINDNPFFRFESSSGESAQQSFEMVYGNGLIVEILYMHDFKFKLEEDKIWTREVTYIERNLYLGHSTSCVHCNMYLSCFLDHACPGYHKNPKLIPQGLP